MTDAGTTAFKARQQLLITIRRHITSKITSAPLTAASCRHCQPWRRLEIKNKKNGLRVSVLFPCELFSACIGRHVGGEAWKKTLVYSSHLRKTLTFSLTQMWTELVVNVIFFWRGCWKAGGLEAYLSLWKVAKPCRYTHTHTHATSYSHVFSL